MEEMDISFTSREAILADEILGEDGKLAIEVSKRLTRDISHRPSFVDKTVEVT